MASRIALMLLAASAAALAAMPVLAQDDSSDDLALSPAWPAPLAARSLLSAAARAGDAVLAVGERGHILRSSDDGESWRQMPSPVSVFLTDIACPTAMVCYASGHDAVILKTSDGGESWSLVFSAPEWDQPLFAIAAADADRVIAVGAFGLVVESANAGANWLDSTASLETLDPHLYGVAILPDGGTLTVGEAGAVLFRRAGGESWTAQDAGYDGSFFGVAIRPQGWLVYGLQGTLRQSLTAGRSWVAITGAPPTSLYGHGIAADGSVLLVGGAGHVLRLTADGALADIRQHPERPDLLAALRAEAGLLLFGEDGVLTAALPLSDASLAAARRAQRLSETAP